ncbi:hypothetical protein [Yoonia sp.]|uniref:hypothetical protein n=1 Tax=Yoonia sp. TaxID=2212373 RepID=UPI00358F4E4C
MLQRTLSADQQRLDLSHGVQIRGHLFMDNLATHENASAAKAMLRAGCWFLFIPP